MFRYPVNYIAITDYFSTSHRGLDLGWNSKYGGSNQPVYASKAGVVYAIKDNDKNGKSWGNFVKINHGNKVYTLYGHLKNGIKVKVGQKVKQGTLIGYMGNTGDAKGNHCHFEMYVGGEETKYRVDPLTRTYVYPGQIVSSNKDAIRGLKYYSTEVNNDDSQTIKELNNQIQELKDKNSLLEKNNIALQEKNKELEELNQSIINSTNSFKLIYKCTKTGDYRINISLIENEELYLK